MMMQPSDVRKYIAQIGADYGQNVLLPDDIDTSGSTEFFGTRCSDNVHVKGSRLAHIDRVDPCNNPLGHLKQDVGIPYVVMFSLIGALIGVLLYKNKKKGAKIGGIMGALCGLIIDIAEEPIIKKVENKIS